MDKLIVGNWKMNGNLSLVDEFINSVKNKDVVIAFPSVFISYIYEKNPKFKIAAQDCSIFSGTGAHTGEVSAHMLSQLGVQFIIIGHSERRISSELDSVENVYKKLTNTLDSNTTPILCIDEEHLQLIDERTMLLLRNNADKIILAYEPLSAIGTGVIPTLEEIHDAIYDIKNRYFNIRTLYGGSVNSKNVAGILDIPMVDGVLIGGASLKTTEINAITN